MVCIQMCVLHAFAIPSKLFRVDVFIYAVKIFGLS